MRSTEDKLIHIPMNVGMNQAVDTRLAPTGTLDSVQNCRISGSGILEKRPGSIALTGTTANSPTHSLQGNGTTTNIELPAFACQVQSALMVGNTYGDAFAFSTVWQFQGRFSTCLPVRKRYGLSLDDTMGSGGLGDGFGATQPDIVVTQSGYIGVIALTKTGLVHFYIEDSNGVRIYYLNSSLTSVVQARLVFQSDTIYIVHQIGANISVLTLAISGGIVAAPTLTSILPLAGAGSTWDVSSYSSTAWFIAYQNAAAQVGLVKFSGTTNVTSTFFAVVANPIVAIWADPITQQLWLGIYDNAVDVRFSVWDVSSTIVNVKALTTLKSAADLGPPVFGRYRGVVPNTTKKAFYCFRQLNVGGSNTAATWVGAAFGSATAPTTPVACWHVTPISKPDNFNRVWCIINSTSGLTFSNQLLTRAVLLRFADESLAAPPTIELSSPNMPMVTSLPVYSSVNIAVGASRCYFAFVAIQQQFYGAQAIAKIEVYEYTTAEQEAHRHATRFGVTTAVSGQPVEFFGQSVSTINPTGLSNVGALAAGASEIGFPHAPIIFSITPSNVGSGFQAIGTRSWRVTYEWVDMYGRRHQSAPSAPVSSTSDASHVSATLVIGTTDITQRQAANTGLRVFLKVYRTVAGGTEYHECSATAVAFDQSDGLITFIDLEADFNIANTGFLYTDGGVLDDTLAPSCRFMCKSEDRIWFGGLWDANIIQCSKVIVPEEPIQCTDDFSHQVQLPAPCTGLAYMDGNVVAFAADAIYLVSGDGPNDQGVGSFPPPRCLTRSIGCCDYRSIVETNVGIMFQSNQGFYLLPRGFGPAQYVGAAVRTDMAALGNQAQDFGPVVLGAISHSTRDNHVVRFLVAAGSSPPPTTASDVFTYDIDNGQWYHDTMVTAMGEIGAFDSLASTGNKGAVFVRANLSTLISTAPVSVESPSQAGDESASAVITQFAETAWVHPFGLGGYGKVNCVLFAVEGLGTSQALDVSVQTDTNTAETASWTIAGPGINYRMLVVNVRACTAVRVSMRCAAPVDVVGGFKFISCTLEVEPTSGIRLLADSEKN